MLAGLVSDYELYKRPGVTFVSICTSMTATTNSLKRQVDIFKLKPFATMLDSGGMTASSYHVPKNAKFWLVVIDGDGKIAYNASQGWIQDGKPLHHIQVEKSLSKFTSLLYDIAPPKDMAEAAHLFELQQFTLMEAELNRVLATTKSSENTAFASNLHKKVVEVRKQRAAQIDVMSATNPVQAYREAVVFVSAFPQCSEIEGLRTMVAKLKRDPKVSEELRAEEAYQFQLVPEMRKTTNMSTFDKKLKPLADSYLQAFGKTDFGSSVVASAVEAHRLAILAAASPH